MPTSIRGSTQADVLAGEETPWALADGVNGQQSLMDDGGETKPAAGGGTRQKGGFYKEIASNARGTVHQNPGDTSMKAAAAAAVLLQAYHQH